MAPVVRLFLFVFAPLAFPISKLLDRFLSTKERSNLYARSHLKALIGQCLNVCRQLTGSLQALRALRSRCSLSVLLSVRVPVEEGIGEPALRLGRSRCVLLLSRLQKASTPVGVLLAEAQRTVCILAVLKELVLPNGWSLWAPVYARRALGILVCSYRPL